MLQNIIKKLDWARVTELTNDLRIYYYTNCRTLDGQKKFSVFWVPTVYNIKFQKEFQSYHMYSGSIEQGTRVYPLIEESLVCQVLIKFI